MAWQTALVSLLRFFLGRLTHFIAGVYLTIGGLRHIFMAGESMAAAFGLPTMLAFILGFPVTFLGLLYLVAALQPVSFMT